LPEQWRWLPTNKNSADVATRANFSKETVSPPEWLNGPDFLRHPENDWPSSVPASQTADDPERLPKRILHAAEGECLIKYENFSSYTKLLGTIAHIFRYMKNCKSAVDVRKQNANFCLDKGANKYLPQLIRRPKWLESTEPLRPEQLVMILDHNLPQSQWKRGRIISVVKAKDGHVRTAEVMTSQGLIRRSVSKLAALQLSES